MTSHSRAPLREPKIRNRSLTHALVATTLMACVVTIGILAWQSGYPQWAFALIFLSVWLVISISWSNVRFNEESGLMLAGIMDHNFREMQVRIEELEQELLALKEAPAEDHASHGDRATSLEAQ